jgi:hypothetical protein
MGERGGDGGEPARRPQERRAREGPRLVRGGRASPSRGSSPALLSCSPALLPSSCSSPAPSLVRVREGACSPSRACLLRDCASPLSSPAPLPSPLLSPRLSPLLCCASASARASVRDCTRARTHVRMRARTCVCAQPQTELLSLRPATA